MQSSPLRGPRAGEALRCPKGAAVADPRGTQEDHAAARAYLTSSRKDALAQHPRLAQAYATEEALRQAVIEAKPLAPAIQVKNENTIRNSVAAAVARGQEPKATERAASEIRLQVAIDSAEHAIAARRMDLGSSLNISNEHRVALVKHAEEAVTTPNDPKRPDFASERQARAREIAGNIGLLDMPRTNNPFQEGSLVRAYVEQQAEAKARQLEQGRQQPDRGRGIER